MMDIVERLRDYMEGSGGFRVQLCIDAADEIERLRADAEQDDRLRVACLELRDEARAEIERLRARCTTLENTAKINLSVAKQRGLEIERLRAALQSIRLTTTWYEATRTATIALNAERWDTGG